MNRYQAALDAQLPDEDEEYTPEELEYMQELGAERAIEEQEERL